MNENNRTSQDFESAMLELEALVSKIETGDLSLEDSLKEFEKGIKLSQTCQKALSEAEQRVKILTDSLNSNGDNEADFEPLSD